MLVQPAAASLGAFVSDVALTEVLATAAAQQQLEQLLVTYQVLFFRDQALTPSQLAELARCFGRLQPHGAYDTTAAVQDVQVLASTADKPSKIELWHSDMTFAAAPPKYTFLHAQIVPAVGGDTLWASAAAAWEALSPTMQALLLPLQAIHDFRFGFQESLAEPGGSERLADVVARNPPVTHPVVRVHPQSGRRAIFVNPLFTRAIEGLAAHESRHLLEFLYQHTSAPEFTVRLQWQPNTVAIWDNRCTQHKPINDYFPAERKLHRVTVAGGDLMQEQTEVK